MRTPSRPRSVTTPVRCVVRTTAPEISVTVAFWRPITNEPMPVISIHHPGSSSTK
jgi:hypothetical protein